MYNSNEKCLKTFRIIMFFYIGPMSIHWKQRDIIWYIAIDDPKLLLFSPNKTRKASCMSDLSDNN